MIVNLYKIDEDLNIINVQEKLIENGYSKQKIEKEKSTSYILYLKEIDMEPVFWKRLLKNSFEISSLSNIEDVTRDIRAILVIKQYNKIYALSFGKAFHDLYEIIDYDFGINFAEKTLTESAVDVKSVDFFQTNKLREIINFKNKSSSTINATESFSFVSGKPNYKGFGNKISCGLAVKFNKPKFENSFLKNLAELCIDINDALGLKNKVTLPRIEKIRKNTELSKSIFQKLKRSFIDDELQTIDVKQIVEMNTTMHFICDYELTIRISKQQDTNTQSLQSYSLGAIQEYIKNSVKSGYKFSFEDIYIRAKHHNSIDTLDAPLSSFLYCDLEYKNQIYVLQYGMWGVYNEKYLEVLNNTLDEIPLFIDKKRTIINHTDEGKYIEEKVKQMKKDGKDCYAIHKQFIRPNKTDFIRSIDVELGDIYIADNSKKELIAVKKGGNVKDTIYSIEQSLLSLLVMNYLSDFNISGVSHILDKHDIKEIKKTSIIWIFLSDINDCNIYKGEKKKIEKILNEDIVLKRDFNSLYLKNKLVEWYLLCRESSKDPKIIFEVPIVQ